MSRMQIGDEIFHVPWDDVRILTRDENERFKSLRNKQRLTAQRDELNWRIKKFETENSDDN